MHGTRSQDRSQQQSGDGGEPRRPGPDAVPRPFEPAVERVEQDQEWQQPEHEQEGVERVGQRRNSGESGHQRQERASAGAQGVRVDPHRRPRGRGAHRTSVPEGASARTVAGLCS